MYRKAMCFYCHYVNFNGDIVCRAWGTNCNDHGVASDPWLLRTKVGVKANSFSKWRRKSNWRRFSLCTIEVINGRLQLGELRSCTFIQVVEAELFLATVTVMVCGSFESIIRGGNTIVLVDCHPISFTDDEGAQGTWVHENCSWKECCCSTPPDSFDSIQYSTVWSRHVLFNKEQLSSHFEIQDYTFQKRWIR